MLMPALTIEVKDNRTLVRRTKALAAPLLGVAAILAGEARERIATKQTMASGQPMPRYSKFAKYLREREATGSPIRRSRRPAKERWDLSRRGQMWRSLKLRLQSPVKATAGFYGGVRGVTVAEHKVNAYAKAEGIGKAEAKARLANMGALPKRAIKNADLARIHNSKLPGDANHILANTTVTLREAERLVLAGLEPQVFAMLGVADTEHRARRKAAAAERKAKKHQREMRGR
jgi:hypothetical protein